jgi:NADH-quinone oxidoreductase subunit J
MIEALLFYLFAAVLIGAALGVIGSRNSVHSALWLVLAFFTAGMLWILLEAEFLALALVLVYVGAVMVLFLFVVMMLDVDAVAMSAGFTRYLPVGMMVGVVMLFELGTVLLSRRFGLEFYPTPAAAELGTSNTEALGTALYTVYVYPVEIAAVILLVAIVAAISLTLRHRPGVRTQDIAAQVRTRSQDRLHLVDVESEEGGG